MVDLVPHPDFPPSAVERVNVFLDLEGAEFLLDFSVYGQIDKVHLPTGGNLQRRDELWRSTCFEAFIRPNHGMQYFELNFAPSSDWAAYRFDSYRQGITPAPISVTEKMSVVEASGLYELVAEFDLTAVSELSVDCAWSVGLSAVIEERNGNKSYWALKHPDGPPDFHRADCFTLELPAARPA